MVITYQIMKETLSDIKNQQNRILLILKRYMVPKNLFYIHDR